MRYVPTPPHHADPPPGEDPSLETGILLGQRRSLTLMAGQCTAAHAELLRRIRDEKLFLPYASSWAKYCGPHLKISRRHADRLIALLKEFGPVYFELNALVGITPEQYRLIEPCVTGNSLRAAGKVLALTPENAPEIANALTPILCSRRPRAPARVFSLQEKLDRLAAKGRALAKEFELLLQSHLSARRRERVIDSVRAARHLFGSLEPY